MAQALPLPVIVGFGGYNSAGRSSFHHGFCRLVLDSLPSHLRGQTLANLAVMMGLVKPLSTELWQDALGNSLDVVALEKKYRPIIEASSLVRPIDKTYFDVDALPWQQSVQLEQEALTFTLKKQQLPKVLPDSWQVVPLDRRTVQVTVTDCQDVKVPSLRDFPVKGAGQFPTGFDPSQHYPSRFHPRSLQMALLGASDALQSTGLDWQQIMAHIEPHEVAVYSSNIMGQMDEEGIGGMLNARLKGKRVSSKQCPLGHNTMTADFINAYVLGSVGSTGSITGACASFLYNLKAGIEDIQAGRCRVAMVGNSETPITAEVMDGYASMGALATKEGLSMIDEQEQPDIRKSSRPFGENCGFTIAESSQYILLMDDSLALELGAQIHGAVSDVFVNADGVKKSISAPGAGNYITLAQAVASACALLGEQAVREHSFVQAHGSSTPQNRVTESDILNRVADSFAIKDWPVCAVKSHLGHSLAAASGDQLITSLGVFKHHILPGIKTHNRVADDVDQRHLHIVLQDEKVTQDRFQVSFLNSKGFGGNNASAVLLAPQVVQNMMTQRHGEQAMLHYQKKRQHSQQQAARYDQMASQGNLNVIYRFGEAAIDESQLQIHRHGITFPEFKNAITFDKAHRYGDMIGEAKQTLSPHQAEQAMSV